MKMCRWASTESQTTILLMGRRTFLQISKSALNSDLSERSARVAVSAFSFSSTALAVPAEKLCTVIFVRSPRSSSVNAGSVPPTCSPATSSGVISFTAGQPAR